MDVFLPRKRMMVFVGEEAARAALRALHLDDGVDLVPRHGWANEAWIGPSHVVRISSGRLPGSLAHEAAVIPSVARVGIPVAAVVGHGPVNDGTGGEWLVSRRLAGDTLAVAWPDLDGPARRAIGRRLGEILRTLHALDVDLAPPWWTSAHDDAASLHNAYKPRPELGPTLVDAARDLAAADGAMLDEVGALVQERLSLFADDEPAFVHSDVHMHNVLVAGSEITGLLDWEGAHPAAPDVELDMLFRYLGAAHVFPERPGAPVRIAAGDAVELADHVSAAHPELFDRPHLQERLEVYDAHWHLVQLLVTDRLHGAVFEASGDRDPAWDRLRLLLDGRSHLETFRHLLR